MYLKARARLELFLDPTEKREIASGLEPKPRNFTDSEFMKRVKDGYLIEVIGKGTAAFGKSPYCPPWEDTLKDDEKIRNIVAFLRTLYKKTTTENNE